MTYGFLHQHPMDEMHRLLDVEFFPPGATAGRRGAAVGAVPLLFQPGTGWNYGVSTDVLGRVVEVVSGMPLDRFFAEHITGPLGMVDTAFTVPAEKARPVRRPVRDGKAGQTPIRKDDFTTDPRGRSRSSPAAAGWSPPRRTTCASPGCCWAGGELDGVRLLGSRTSTTWPATTCPATSTSRPSAGR